MHKLAIVPFDVAQDLKELGFDWEVKQAYFKSIVKKDKLVYSEYPEMCPVWDNHNDKEYKYKRISAPEQSLVVKWLLDIHNLYVVVEPHFKQWFWEICQINTGDSYAVYYVIETQRRSNPNAYKTHDEAQLGGIKECIKYLKNETISNK